MFGFLFSLVSHVVAGVTNIINHIRTRKHRREHAKEIALANQKNFQKINAGMQQMQQNAGSGQAVSSSEIREVATAKETAKGNNPTPNQQHLTIGNKNHQSSVQQHTTKPRKKRGKKSNLSASIQQERQP